MPAQQSKQPGSSQPPQKVEVLLGDATQRRALIQQIQTLRNSRVIVYVTADRPDVSGQMGDDVVPIVHDTQRISEGHSRSGAWADDRRPAPPARRMASQHAVSATVLVHAVSQNANARQHVQSAAAATKSVSS